jgi:hypothetical protein
MGRLADGLPQAPERVRKAKERHPPIPLPPGPIGSLGTLAPKRGGARYVVEWKCKTCWNA